METEEVIKLVDNIYKNILEKFNPGARQLISAGKAYLKALHGAAAASRIFNEALAKIAVNAQQGGTTDIGSALMNIVGVYKDIQDQHMNILKAFYVDLLVPLETNLEKDTKVVQFEQKKFLQQHKIRADSYSKAAATMKKQRKKKNNPQNADKEIKTIQALDEEKNKMDAFCEQSLKNALTQERRRYGFVLERQCSLSRHWMAYHISGRNVIANQLETWEEVSLSREFLPPNVENMFAKKMKEEMILDDDDSDQESVVSAIRKTKSIDASLLDMRSLGDVINNTNNHTVNGNGMKHNTLNMPRAKSEFNLNTAVVELPPKWDQRPIVKGLYAYLSSGENQLSFLEGDRIALVGERAKGWQFGENLRTQTFGWFPVAYTEIESMENNNNWASMTTMASASSNTQTMTNTIMSGLNGAPNTIPTTSSPSSIVVQHGNGQISNASGVISSTTTTMQTSTNSRNANGHHYYSQNNNNSNMSNGNNMNQSNHYQQQQQQQFYDVTPDSSVDSTLVDETMPSKLINSYHEDIHQSPTRMFGDTMMMRQSKQFRRVSNGVPKPGPPPTLPAPVPTPIAPSYNNNNNNSNLNDNHNLMHSGGNNKNNLSHNGGITQSHSFSSGAGGIGNNGGIGVSNHGNGGGGVGGASMIIDKRKSSPATVNLSKQQQQQSSMNGNNKPKPRTNGITNASLHSSNDSGFANDPPPQPEIDYSDEDLATRVPIRRFHNNNNNNEQINNNKSATRMSRRRSNDFDSTTMQSLTQRQSIKNQQKSLNGKNSRHNSIRQSASFGNLTMNTSTIDTDLSNNINNNNNSSNNFDFLYQTNDANNQITNGKNGKVSVKRTKSFWKFGKSDDDILEGMALWKHRDLVQIENDQLLQQNDANGNKQIRESATINKYHPKMVVKRRKSLENNTTISTNSSETLKNSQNGNNIEDIMLIIDTKRDNQSTIIDDKTKYHITKSDIDQRISMQQQQQLQQQTPDHHIYGNYGNGVQRSKSSHTIGNGNNNNDEIINRIDIDNDIDDDHDVNDHHEDDDEEYDDDDMNSERYHPHRQNHQNNNGKISRSKYLMDIQNTENGSPQYRNNVKQQNNTNKYHTNRSDSKVPYRNATTSNNDYYNQQDQQSLNDMVSKIDFDDDSSYLVESEANLGGGGGGGTAIMMDGSEQYQRHYTNRKHNQNTNTNNRYSNQLQQNTHHQHHHQQHLIENDQRSSYDNNGQFYDDEESVNEVFLKMKTVKRKEILKQYYSSGTDTERHSSSSDPYDCIVVDDHLVRRKQHANGQNTINNTTEHNHKDSGKNAKMDFKTFRSTNGQITSNGGGALHTGHLDDSKDIRIIDSTTTTTRATTLLPRTKLSKALSNGVNNTKTSITTVQSNGNLTNGKKIDKQQSMNNKQQRHSNYENLSSTNNAASTTTTTNTSNKNKRTSSSSSSAIHHQQNNMENPSKSYGPWYDLWGKDATVKK